MKILFTGTTSSGKSTLVEQLKEKKLQGVFFIDELANQLLKQHPGIEKDPHFQDILFQKQTQAELEAERSGNHITVCDRGVLDNIAHARLFGQSIKSAWVEWCQTYDAVYVFNKDDITFEITELQAKLSTRNWLEYREKQHTFIINTLRDMEMKYSLLSGTVEERLTRVERDITLHLLSIEGNPQRNKERL